MSKYRVCCRFYPTCYCNDVPPEDERYVRAQQLPREELDVDVIFSEVMYLEARRRRRNALMFTIGTIVVVVLLAFALAGCDPSNGRGDVESPAPESSDMYTVIYPPTVGSFGGIYDNN